MKKLISSLTIALLIMLSCIVSNAVGMATLSITSNSDTVEAGSEITLYLKLDSVSEIEGLTALQATLDYNKSVFELKSMTGESELNVTVAKNGNFSAITGSETGIKSGNIAKMVFRAIGSPSSGNSAITIKNIEVTDNNTEESHEDIVFNVKVNDPQTSPAVPVVPGETTEPTNPTTPTSPEEPATPTEPTTNVEETVKPVTPTKQNNKTETKNPSDLTVGQTNQNIANQNSTSTKDGTTVKSKIPAAGINISIIILLVTSIVLGIASFMRYKRVK